MKGKKLLKDPQKRFFESKFRHLVTDRSNLNTNDFERHFSIGKFKLNENKLITLNEINAIDENKNSIKIITRIIFKSMRVIKNFDKKYYLYNWSYSTVTGVKKLVFGNFDKNHILNDIEECYVESIPESYREYWSDCKCFNFLDCLLTFMKECVTEELVIYEFEFNSDNRNITCYKHETDAQIDSFLPKWYINAESND
jgi:hypothetical protein